MATTMLLFLVTLLLGSCSATIYNVGDSDGWTTTNYNDWTKGKEFHVGDILVFQYNHTVKTDVTQVSSALQYELCDSSSPKAVFILGYDIVILTEPGYHYFITSNYFQCSSGQKLNILVHPLILPSLPPLPPLPSLPSLPPLPSLPSLLPPPPPRNVRPSGIVYRVGGSRGWSVYDTEYYYNWGKDKEFFVGDSLFFVYRKESNDVYEVSSDVEFITCDAMSPIAVHNTGRDRIRLTEPGVRYFISSNMGHCQDGLKLQVVVRPRPESEPEPVTDNPNVPRPSMGLSPPERRRNRPRFFRPRPRHHN